MPDQPEFGTPGWFSRKAGGLYTQSHIGADVAVLRTAVAEALEWAAEHTGLFMTKGRDFKKGSEIIRAKAKEIRNG